MHEKSIALNKKCQQYRETANVVYSDYVNYPFKPLKIPK